MKLLIMTQAVDADHPLLGFFVDWIQAVAHRSESVIVVAQTVGRHTLPKNVKVVSLGKERGSIMPVKVFRLWQTLIREASHYDATLFHMCPEYVLAAWPVCRLLGKPMTLWYAHKTVTSKLKLAVMMVDRVFTSTREGFRLPTAKLRILSQGIPAGRVRPHRRLPGAWRLLSLGRLSPAKRHEIARQALAEMPDPTVVLTIAGDIGTAADATYADELKQTAERLGVADRVRFSGGVRYDDVWELYANHDLFVHGSRTGSVDKTVLEALVSGVPVVTSSEAFAWLPADMRIPDNDITALVAASVVWRARAGQDPETLHSARQQVLAEHRLEGLADLLLNELSSLR